MADASNGRGRRKGKPSGSRGYKPKGPLGTGERFKQVEASAAAHGAANPAAVAAEAGRRKYGKAGMAALSAAGRKRAAAKRKAGGK